jgi:hypothetical protein
LLIGLERVLGMDWYGSLFLVKVTLVVLTPPMLYRALIGAARVTPRRTEEPAPLAIAHRAAIAVGVAALLIRRIRDAASIAWWSPLLLEATSSSVAFLIGMCGIVAMTRGARQPHVVWQCLAASLWMAATLVHPSIGLFTVVFYYLATIGCWRLGPMLAVLTVTCILPAVAVAVWFQPAVSLDAAAFVRSYVVVNHPFHYLPSEFGTLTRQPWWVSFAGVCLALAAAGAWGWVRRDRRSVLLASVFLAAYAGCVAVQFALVEVWPVKSVAALGPVRFSLFGYYMVVLLVARAVAATVVTPRACGDSATRVDVENPVSQGSESRPWRARLRPMTVPVVLAAAIAVAFVGWRDAPMEAIRRADAEFYDWVSAHTPADAVFAAYFGDLNTRLPLVADRAVLAGAGFPFREDFFAEHDRRTQLLFGTPQQLRQLPGTWIGEKHENFYRSLGPADFVRMAAEFRLDYVVIETGRSAAFRGIRAVYQDTTRTVYAMPDLRS